MMFVMCTEGWGVWERGLQLIEQGVVGLSISPPPHVKISPFLRMYPLHELIDGESGRTNL